jgi:hypothetical protein
LPVQASFARKQEPARVPKGSGKLSTGLLRWSTLPLRWSAIFAI